MVSLGAQQSNILSDVYLKDTKLSPECPLYLTRSICPSPWNTFFFLTWSLQRSSNVSGSATLSGMKKLFVAWEASGAFRLFSTVWNNKYIQAGVQERYNKVAVLFLNAQIWHRRKVVFLVTSGQWLFNEKML